MGRTEFSVSKCNRANEWFDPLGLQATWVSVYYIPRLAALRSIRNNFSTILVRLALRNPSRLLEWTIFPVARTSFGAAVGIVSLSHTAHLDAPHLCWCLCWFISLSDADLPCCHVSWPLLGPWPYHWSVCHTRWRREYQEVLHGNTEWPSLPRSCSRI